MIDNQNLVNFLINNPLFTFRCCCGQSRINHPIVVGVEIGKFGDEWHPNKHTRPHPTDAYGTIEFQGGPHPTKAQVNRKIEGERVSCDKKLKRCKDLSSTFNLSWKYSLLCIRSCKAQHLLSISDCHRRAQHNLGELSSRICPPIVIGFDCYPLSQGMRD